MTPPVQVGIFHMLPALKMETYYPETFLITYHTHGIIT